MKDMVDDSTPLINALTKRSVFGMEWGAVYYMYTSSQLKEDYTEPTGLLGNILRP